LQEVTNPEVYGNGRLATFVMFCFSTGIILFAWIVPSEHKQTNIVLSTLFFFNLNLYVVLPLFSILKNSQIRRFARKQFYDHFLQRLLPIFKINKSKVGAAPT
jgi:hypothetical protein